MRMHGRWPLSGAVIAALATLALVAAPAHAATTASIAGTVSAADGTPLSGICVSAYDRGDGDGYGDGETGADGTYTIGALPPGDYEVSFYDCSGRAHPYVGEYYDDAYVYRDSRGVSVEDGQSVTGIDARLAQGGEIAGTVTGPGGAGAEGVCVYAEPLDAPHNGYYEGEENTDSSGAYRIGGLPPGDYEVYFVDCSGRARPYASQYYSGARTSADGATVTVSAGQSSTGVGARLAPGAEISGKVTNKDGTGVGDICVSPRDDTDDFDDFSDNGTVTGSDGTYTIEGLPSGTYQVDFSDCSDAGYLPESYGEDSSGAADDVSATEGQDHTGIDASLTLGGRISGTVTDLSGAPISGICVRADADGDGDRATTGDDGAYTITGLESGNYTVEFDDCSDRVHPYLAEYYDDARDNSDAKNVAVIVEHTASGIDARLQRGGEISGTVTDGQGGPVADICVDAENDDDYGSAETGPDGNYTITGLHAGSFTVEFSDCSDRQHKYLDEYYDDKTAADAPDQVAVTVGQTTSGIDARLVQGSEFSGTVTATDGSPIEGICVEAESTDPASGGWGYAQTAADGTYIVSALPAGSYTVRFSDECGDRDNRYVSEDYPDPVTVAPGSPMTGIDATLEAEGRLTGTVTDAGGDPLGDICVAAAESGDDYDFYDHEAQTGRDGTYAINDLDAGSYKVRFTDCSDRDDPYAGEYYEGKASDATATPVSVALDRTTADIDAALEPGGRITGTVLGPDGSPAQDVCVDVEGAGSSDFSGWAETDADGAYTVVGLPTGSYTVAFEDCSDRADRYLDEYYDDKDGEDAATPVDVTVAQTTPDIDARLALGGEITGTVTGPDGAPVAGIEVQASSTREGGDDGYATTDSSGRYTITPLHGGDYTVSFSDYSCEGGDACYLSEYYGGGATADTADSVAVVVAQKTQGIDAQLSHGGSISGTVTGPDGKPVADVCVGAQPAGSADPYADGNRSSATTDAAGHYTLPTLRTGSYKVGFSDCSGRAQPYAPEYYDDKGSAGAANAVSVVDPDATTGIDAQLAAGGTITGKVTGPDGRPDEACVSAMPADGSYYDTAYPYGTDPQSGSGYTDNDGSYTISGLQAGAYVVEFRDCGGRAHPYATEYYDDQPGPDAGHAVTVTAGGVASGIDAQLDKGGEISGTVTGPDGKAVFTCISAYRAGSDTPVAQTSTARDIGYSTDYTLWGLRPGDYRIGFADCPNADKPYVPEFYNDKPRLDQADPVTVTADQTKTGIDAQLAQPGGGGSQVAPVVSTGTADGVTSSAATLRGTVDPKGAKVTDCHFEYGRSTSYGSSVACAQDAGDGSAAVDVSASLSALDPGATYHFRLVAANAGGTTRGDDASFTTAAAAAPPETSITDGPAGTTNATGALFTFTSDRRGAAFECRLDGGAWAACSSPKSYTGLAAGQHAFAVRAGDGNGTFDASPASRSWTIDPATTKQSYGGSAPAGGTVGSDPTGHGATTDDPVTASVTSPSGGDVSLVEEPSTTADPAGYSIFGREVRITAPPASADTPLRLVFTIDASAIPAGADTGRVTAVRDGAPAADCTGSGTATPDPCVSGRQVLAGGDLRLTVLSSHASTWNFALRSPSGGGRDSTRPAIAITAPADGAAYEKGAPVNAAYACTDSGGSGLASCAGPVGSGRRIDTSTVGSHAFTVTATDRAGNSAAKTVHYTVTAPPGGGGTNPGGGGQQPGTGPAPAQPLVPAKLAVSRVRIAHHRIQIRATITRLADGERVKVSFSAGGHRLALPVKVRRGRLNVARKLPKALRGEKSGTVTFRYAGSDAVLPATAKLHAAGRDAGLKVGKVRLRGKRLTVTGSVSKRARGKVDLLLTWEDANLDPHQWTGKAKIQHLHGGARWRLSRKLPADALDGGSLAVTYGGRGDVSGERLVERVGRG